ncbi:MAG: hypothetical protein ABR609_04510 [Acidimicrobiia bacterium]
MRHDLGGDRSGIAAGPQGGGNSGRSLQPRAPGAGDPYFPLAGNGGYGTTHFRLHVLRHTIGDDVFFELLNEWATMDAGGNVTTDQFIAVAESLSGQELDDLFHTWLFTAQKPTRTLIPDAAVSLGDVPAIARGRRGWGHLQAP